MKKTLFITCLILSTCYAQSQTSWGAKFTNAIISRYQPTINSMTKKGWEYSNGVILHGIEKIYLKNQTDAYFKYIKAYVDSFVNAAGDVKGLAVNVDRMQPGMLCLFLYEKTGLLKYKTAATNIRNYILGTPTVPSLFKKTPNGGYWHKDNGNYIQVMLIDGMYMMHPFLAKYGSMFKDTTCFTVASFQPLLLGSIVMPTGSNLPKHGWDYSKVKPWANPITGTSSEVWSRGTGWFIMALVDILTYLPKTHRNYAPLLSLYQRVATGVKATQDPVSGLWYQVMDKGTLPGNYLESSGTGMFVYALKKGIEKGYISSSAFLPVVQKAWAGLQTKFATYTDGKPQITSFAPAMTTLATYEQYVNTLPVKCPSTDSIQHPHGYFGVLLACGAMESLTTTIPAAMDSKDASLDQDFAERSNSKVLVYPIPFTTDVYVRLANTNTTRKEIQVKNMAGVTIATQSVNNSTPITHVTMPSGLSKGMYMLCVVEEGKTIMVKKIVKE